MRLTTPFRFLAACGARAAIIVVAATVATSPARASGDVATGQALFTARCSACHSLNPTRKPGPLLAGVYGRRAGAVPAYHYSTALKGAAITWNDDTLDHWLRSPPAFIPGVNMLAQVDSEQDRQNLIAYLKSLGKPTTAQNASSSGHS